MKQRHVVGMWLGSAIFSMEDEVPLLSFRRYIWSCAVLTDVEKQKNLKRCAGR
jgi:hypothetical protein